jgi:hypothetical protein
VLQPLEPPVLKLDHAATRLGKRVLNEKEGTRIVGHPRDHRIPEDPDARGPVVRERDEERLIVDLLNLPLVHDTSSLRTGMHLIPYGIVNQPRDLLSLFRDGDRC